MGLPALVAKWIEIRDQRLELDSISKLLKDGPEKEAADAVTAWLAIHNLRNASCPGLGTAAIRRDTRVELEDHALMARFLRDSLNEAAERGEPLLDRLCLQKRAAQGEMLDYAKRILSERGAGKADLDDADKLNEILNPLGFSARCVESLHFTKERQS